MKSSYITYLFLECAYIIFCATMPSEIVLFWPILFGIGIYQVLRKEMLVKENYKSYLFLFIEFSALFLIPVFNDIIPITKSKFRIIGFGSLIYWIIFYYFRKYILQYDKKQHVGQKRILSIKEKLLMTLSILIFSALDEVLYKLIYL